MAIYRKVFSFDSGKEKRHLVYCFSFGSEGYFQRFIFGSDNTTISELGFKLGGHIWSA